SHAGTRPDMIGGIGTKGLSVWQIDMEAGAIRVGPSSAATPCIRLETRRNLEIFGTRLISTWGYLNNLLVVQFRFALHLVQVLYRGACFTMHGCSLLPAHALAFMMHAQLRILALLLHSFALVQYGLPLAYAFLRAS